MARNRYGIVVILLLLTSPLVTPMPEIEALPGLEPALMPVEAENPRLGALPLRLPAYDVLVREYDRSVLISLEYIPELWVGRRGRGRLDFCFDIDQDTYCPVDPEPPHGAGLSAALRASVSNVLNRVAYLTRPGVSLGYAFKP
jgi:hypothetical protein